MTHPTPLPTAIIGAGLAGLAAALALSAHGLPVTLFDAGTAPGGRLSTHRAGGWRFDHGGQFLTVRDAGFRDVMGELVGDGHAAPWMGHVVRLSADGSVQPHVVERFVGLPGMDGIIRGLIARLPEAARPRFGSRVTAVTGTPGHWHLALADDAQEGPFTRVVIAVPAPLAARLLSLVAPALATRAAQAVMAPCRALMLGYGAAVLPPWDAAFLGGAGAEDRPLSWIAHDGGKPGRDGRAGFIAHAAPAWSERHREDTDDAVITTLLPAFRAATGITAEPAFLALHHWPHALPTAPLSDGYLWDAPLGLGACGDWCLEARAEAAFVSGARLAAAMGA
ncbi:NAD(P)/FAD-dependent oxidoreductase [Niveispirillum sp. KHB5.9]|uniref:NAD(P)/FAD-dependent oxidoreductase n=1 Tax=Niveispirillum sp. KHB5.9 TaxID=3400269 RepID=UPI003A8835EB